MRVLQWILHIPMSRQGQFLELKNSSNFPSILNWMNSKLRSYFKGLHGAENAVEMAEALPVNIEISVATA